ncbi:MAG: hypothetical protein Q7T03_01410 [Deltaproteobacteria bacterium]|nr:hypothetical protein [Deltaproteobacteria bacterium]
MSDGKIFIDGRGFAPQEVFIAYEPHPENYEIDQQCWATLRALDKNNDGLVTFEEVGDKMQMALFASYRQVSLPIVAVDLEAALKKWSLDRTKIVRYASG